ncbi:MAG: S9 family peptidase, partial [Bacteroidota bacterium]
MKNLILLMLLLTLAGCELKDNSSNSLTTSNQIQKVDFKKIPVKYPDVKKNDVVDDYHGTAVRDPYRWLEDDNADDTKAWVTAQNEVTFDYLDQ